MLIYQIYNWGITTRPQPFFGLIASIIFFCFKSKRFITELLPNPSSKISKSFKVKKFLIPAPPNKPIIVSAEIEYIMSSEISGFLDLIDSLLISKVERKK